MIMPPRNCFSSETARERRSQQQHHHHHRVELLEIRPLRPNQDIILPGVGVVGRGVKFESKERGSYHSRAGFAQCDGITQFSGSFRIITNKAPPPSLSFSGCDDNDPIFPRIDKSLLLTNYDSFQNSLSFGSKWSADGMRCHSAHWYCPHTLSNRPNARDVKQQLDAARFVVNLRQRTRLPSRKYAFGRTIYEEDNLPAVEQKLPKIKYQNYVVSSEDEAEGLSAVEERKDEWRKRRQKTPNQSEAAFSRPSSLASLDRAQDFLFERRLQELRRKKKPKAAVAEDVGNGIYKNDDEEEDDSFDESEEISILGEELVQRSLEEVAKSLSASSAGSTPKDGSRRVTFAAAKTDPDD